MPPVYYDVTHLRHNARRAVLSGIRRVDFEFARHFFAERDGTRAVQYRIGGIGVLRDTAGIKATIARHHAADRQAGQAGAPQVSADALIDIAARSASGRDRRASPGWHKDLVSFARFVGVPPFTSSEGVARDAIYLNIAQHNIGYDFFFSWLRRRRDVRALFFIHDLLPLDYPEFWPAGYRAQFRKGFDTLADVAAGFMVSSEAVRSRLADELRRQGRPARPILALPFPVFGGGPRIIPAPGAAPSEPYFVMVGTIEPRKNHRLILNVWRHLAEAGATVPKLVILGRRGWTYGEVAGLLERSHALRGHVVEASAVDDAAMRQMVANARAVLFPSFAEGFGLPVAEALMAGTPVVASDIPVLHETAQGKALFLDPIDGVGWAETVLALCDPEHPLARHARALALAFEPVAPAAYFAAVDAFVERFA